ncbi:MAG: hypothetical protein ACYC27_21085, partial [Armatimonadota bacterium]
MIINNIDYFKIISRKLLDTMWRSNPVSATAFGIHDYDHTLGDVTSESQLAYGREFKQIIEELQSISELLINSDVEFEYHLALSLASNNYIIFDQQRPRENN